MSTGSKKQTVTPINIKKESNTDEVINNNLRLASFSIPRDLTLGGSGQLKNQRGGASKKVYAPNLNVTRNKNVNVKTSLDTTVNRGGRGRSNRGNKSTNQGGRNNSLIQTSGVFSDGVGGLNNLRKSSSSSSLSRYDSGADKIRKPTLIKKENNKNDSIADKQYLKDILGENDDRDYDEDDKTDLGNLPIKLKKRENENITQKLDKCNELFLNTYPSSLKEIFSTDKSHLFLLQLPDTLPRESLDNQESEKASKSDDQDSESKSFLGECSEGLIGKVLRYKSGKYKLVLGHTHFDLDLGMETGFLQEIVSIDTNREERSGNMINLGKINSKLTAIPDWTELLKNDL